MARMIANTPLIEGEDAKRFRKNLIESLAPHFSNSEIKAKKLETKEMINDYKQMVVASNGVFY
jgi:hypothetical protein